MTDHPSRFQIGLLTLLAIGCSALICRLLFFVDWAIMARNERELLRNEIRIEQAQTFIRRATALRSQRAKLADALGRISKSYIAPSNETFPWASHFISLHASRIGLDIRVLTPLSIRVAPWEGLTADERQMKLFAVRLDVLATYADTMKLVGLMEEENPLMTLTSLTVIDTGTDGGLSRVTMVWEWPMWKSTPEAAALQSILKSKA